MNPASPANANKATTTPPRREAPTRNEQLTSEKRKRGESDEGSPTTKKGKVVQDDDKSKAEIYFPLPPRSLFTPERTRLRRHMEPQFERDSSGKPVGLKHYPLFRLQRPPEWPEGEAKCKLGKCNGIIQQGIYRIALTPGMYTKSGYENYPWYYHVKCFENILDLSSPHYAARFEADRERDGFTPDIKAVEILEEYILRWKLKASKNEVESPATLPSPAGKTGESSEATSVNQAWALADRLHQRKRQRMEISYRRHSKDYQFDPEDHLEENEWDINKYLLPATHPEYSERHALSQALDAHCKELEDDEYDDLCDWAY